MTTYCSYLDVSYLPRFIALVESMAPLRPGDAIKVLALDNSVEEFFRAYPIPGLEVTKLTDFESAFPVLSAAKKDRTALEYVFTLTPFLIKYHLERSFEGTLVVYLDADLYFFDSPQKVVDELGTSAIGFMPHRFNARIAKKLSKYGLYNVGWVGIRNSKTGRECVDWWTDRCLEWCLDTPIDGKYADQGYLDKMPMLFSEVKVLENRGFNLAPWNTSGQRFSKDIQGNVLINNETPLVFFHFQGLTKVGKWMATSQLNYRSNAPAELTELVYKPYLVSFKRAEEVVNHYSDVYPARKLSRGRGIRKIVRNTVSKVLLVVSALTGNLIDMSKLK